MGFYNYLDIETTSIAPEEGSIVAITTQNLTRTLTPGPLIVRKAWEHPRGEEGILRDFLRSTNFFGDPWKFIPMGFGLSFEFHWLLHKAHQHGILPSNRGWPIFWDKPKIDFKDICVMMAFGEFKGTRLSKFSRKATDGQSAVKFIEAKDWNGLSDYIQREADGFRELFERLSHDLPAYWNGDLSQKVKA